MTDGRVTLGELEAHLWESANILRGPVDQADFKSYVFPLLFLKRISDVYDEEFRQALEESESDVGYAGLAENHRFQIPDKAHWSELRERTENVGQAIQSAMRAIEQANPAKLYGIFGDTQWTNKERLSDALLRDLVDHYSKLPLGNLRVEPDILGNAYEYLIKKFADLSKKKAGEFYTPRSVVKMLVNVLDPEEGETAYDPACGTGGMLIEVVQHVKDQGGRAQLQWGKVFGQEKNLTTAGIARMNLFLHGVEDFEVVRGDTLREPAFFVGDELATFDCVIANPPFSLKKWGEEVWAADRFGRNFAGVPPKKSGDFAWVEHMVKSMAAKSGRLAVVLPQGALFRGAAEKRIRRSLLEADLIEAVIGLAPNLFYGTSLAACVMVLRQRKAPDHRRRVLVVDASTLFKRGRKQNTLEDEHRERIEALYAGFADEEGFAYVADLDEIASNEFDLNIGRYVAPAGEEEPPTLAETTEKLKAALKEADAAEEHLLELLKAEGLIDERGVAT
ncbi:MAG TPA: class I SAM-dependent DNA methyltransferase [Solirubrobacterales bacterium]|nr:class I SAM-dependent DNA methyltransferase [Solirubrobacterales bacterium]